MKAQHINGSCGHKLTKSKGADNSRGIDYWLVHPPHIALEHKNVNSIPVLTMVSDRVESHHPLVDGVIRGMIGNRLDDKWGPVVLDRDVVILRLFGTTGPYK